MPTVRREAPSVSPSPSLKARNRSAAIGDRPLRHNSSGSLASTGSSGRATNPSSAAAQQSPKQGVQGPKRRSSKGNVPPNKVTLPAAGRRPPAIGGSGVAGTRGGQICRTDSRVSAAESIGSDSRMSAAASETGSIVAGVESGSIVADSPCAGQSEKMSVVHHDAAPAKANLGEAIHVPRSLTVDFPDSPEQKSLLQRRHTVHLGTIKDTASDRSATAPGQHMPVKVVTRIRPRLKKELLPKGVIARGNDPIEVQFDAKTMVVSDGQGRVRQFTVDDVIDSRKDDAEGSQVAFFAKVGRDLVQRALAGYNVCVFAYGHTGSGKTHTMLGSGSALVPTVRGASAGFLPRFLEALHFDLTERHQESHYQCEFFEVYNERIRDLLAPPSDHGHQRNRAVHVHPKHGVHIEDLHPSEIQNIEEAFDLIHFGNQMRTVASTTLNQRSSRSHAIFRFKFEHAEQEAGTGSSTEGSGGGGCQSTVTFVDLAGRECHSQGGLVFKEMTYINTSLFYLAVVISKLAEGSVKKNSLADFRNSKLTLLLSQALMGNCTTAVVTTISPLSEFYDDTVSTLSFAQTVKKLQTAPVTNKGRRDIIAELEAEVRKLRQELNEARTDAMTRVESTKQIHAAESLMMHYRRDKRETASISEQLARDRAEAAERIGLLAPASASGQNMSPFLTNLSNDPSLQGVCNYFIREGSSVKVGSDASVCGIVLEGVGINPVMCEIHIDSTSNEVSIRVLDNEDCATARLLVNGVAVQPGTCRVLHHRDCLMFGYSRSFRLIIPTEAKDSGFGDLDVDSALSEIADTTGEQFKAVLPFLSQLQNRATKTAVEEFMKALHKVCPLIDEANLITKVVRESDPLRFELHALTDFFDYDNDKPELVVCVLLDLKGLERLRKGVQTAFLQMKGKRTSITKDVRDDQQLGHARIPLVHQLNLDDQMVLGRRGGHSLLYVWSLEKFLSRLQTIRELYEEGRLTGDNFATVRQKIQEQRHLDPWHEASLAAIQYEIENARGMDEFHPVTLGARRLSSTSDANASETNPELFASLESFPPVSPPGVPEMKSEASDERPVQTVTSPSTPSLQGETLHSIASVTLLPARQSDLPSPVLQQITEMPNQVTEHGSVQQPTASGTPSLQKGGPHTIAAVESQSAKRPPLALQQGAETLIGTPSSGMSSAHMLHTAGAASSSSVIEADLPSGSLLQAVEVPSIKPEQRTVQTTTASSVPASLKDRIQTNSFATSQASSRPNLQSPNLQQITEMPRAESEHRVVQGTASPNIPLFGRGRLQSAVATAPQLTRQLSPPANFWQEPVASDAAVLHNNSMDRGCRVQERSASPPAVNYQVSRVVSPYEPQLARPRSLSPSPPSAPPILTASAQYPDGQFKVAGRVSVVHDSPTVIRRAKSDMLLRPQGSTSAMPMKPSANFNLGTKVAGFQTHGGQELLQAPGIPQIHPQSPFVTVRMLGSAMRNNSPPRAKEELSRMVSLPSRYISAGSAMTNNSAPRAREEHPRMASLPSRYISAGVPSSAGGLTTSSPPPSVDFFVRLTDAGSGQTMCGAAMYLYHPPFPLDAAMKFGRFECGPSSIGELFFPPPGWGLLRSSAGLLIWLNLRAGGSPSEAICERLASSLRGRIRFDFEALVGNPAVVVGEPGSSHVQQPQRVSISADVCGSAENHVAVLSDEGLLRFSGKAAIKVRLASCFDQCIKELFSVTSRFPDEFPSQGVAVRSGCSASAPVTVVTSADLFVPPPRIV